MLSLYSFVTRHSAGLLSKHLSKRLARGKEDSARLDERKGIGSRARPAGALFWVHAASVGEGQSALILIEHLLAQNPELHVLITTGTTTSAQFLEDRMDERCFHHYIPLDHPDWVQRFLDHWQPNGAFWMESELWPNMLMQLQARGIPAALINARLSQKSFERWRWVSGSMKALLKTFRLILAQDADGATRYKKLGAKHVHICDNLKYSSAPLPHNQDDFKALVTAIAQRPVWLYASTHAGEEEIACQAHRVLKASHPDLLTIIVPRHPERGDDIADLIKSTKLGFTQRGKSKTLPAMDDDIYLADTLGELGLFYRLSPIACIGRSLSADGGGGHNPIEAAQLNCAVLHGINVQFQKDIFTDMDIAGAAIEVCDADGLTEKLDLLLKDHNVRARYQDSALCFAKDKTGVIDTVMAHLTPLIKQGLSAA